MKPPPSEAGSGPVDSDGVDELDASCSDSQGHGHDGGLCTLGTPFPSDEYLSLLDGLNQVALSNFAPQQLSACLKSAQRIIRQGDRCASLKHA